MVQSTKPVLKLFLSDAREGVAPCFSSLSRCLYVMTASRLFSPGLQAGALSKVGILLVRRSLHEA